ncbi:MAG: PAS domain S-box protein [Microscillaceae bacterium]|nr:PAS domain S-box protein [Microscillaceae bacterium]
MIISQLIIQYDISQQDQDAFLINVAGRQRMLSQRIAKRTLYLQNEVNDKKHHESSLKKLQILVEEFEKTHHTLQFGKYPHRLKGKFSPAIDSLFDKTIPFFQVIKKICLQIIQSPSKGNIDNAVKILEANELSFLSNMEALLNALVADSQQKLNRLKWIELSLALVAFLVLLMEFFFIISPLIKNLSLTNHSLQASNSFLAEINQELKAIFDSTHVAIMRLDLKGQFVHFNKGAEKMLGYRAEEVIGKHTPALIHLQEEIEVYNQALSKSLNKHLDGFEALRYEARLPISPPRQWTYLRKDGSTLPVQLSTSSIKDEQGNLIGYLGVATDISELMQARISLLESKQNLEILANKLARQNEQLLSFAHITSHNLRSPVSNLNSLLFLYHDSQDEAEKQLLFSKFEIVIGHLTETLNELIETLKIQEDTEIKRDTIVFEELFSKIRETFAGTLLETKAEVSTDFSGLPQISYPKTYLESIFLNLFSNALKYRSPDRILLIEIKTHKAAGKEILRIRDNGLGIDLNKHGEKIFGLRKTFHQHAEAKGIGLFITKTQIEAMGGKIEIESQVDIGTTFTIVFNETT